MSRAAYFQSKCKPKASKRPLDSIKSVEPSLFPPCKNVLIQQIKRAWYVAKMYKHATDEDPTYNVTPLDYGWKLAEERMEIRWYEGDQVPSLIEDLEEDDEADAEESEVEEDNESDEGSDEENDDM